MKAYRILPRTDEEHTKDMQMLDFLQDKMDWCDKLHNDEKKRMYERLFDLYAELEETYSRLNDVKEDRDYYREKCNDAGIR